MERRQLRRVVAAVSKREWAGQVPQYSIRVGTLQVLADGTERINMHLSIYDALDAAQLLSMLSEKYIVARQQEHDELYGDADGAAAPPSPAYYPRPPLRSDSGDVPVEARRVRRRVTSEDSITTLADSPRAIRSGRGR